MSQNVYSQTDPCDLDTSASCLVNAHLTPAMFNTLKSKLQKKSKQPRAPCLCGCGATSPTTISHHRKKLEKKARLTSLNVARLVSGNPTPSTSRSLPSTHLSHQEAQDQAVRPMDDTSPAAEDQMDIDQSSVDRSHPGGPSSNLRHVWAGRTSRRERQDEDLISEPGSPEPSEDEGENDATDHGGGSVTDTDFFTDDETEPTANCENPPAHVEISARDQLTTDFRLHAARAGV